MPRISKRQTATLSLIASLGPFQFDTYLPALPALMIFMHASDTMVQLTITASLLGMASGQLFVGPVIDALGRRRPLLVALTVFIFASIACLTATNVVWMIVARYVLGFSAAAGFVINNAFIRDVAAGQNASRLYATQAAISSLAPVVAPLVGGQLLLLGDWHIVFVFLTALGAAVLGMAAWLMPETLAIEHRIPLTFRNTFSSWRWVLRDKRFVKLALISGIQFGVTCVFLAGAPFVLEHDYQLSPTQYTFAFASVTAVMFAANSLNRWFLKRVPSVFMLRYGLSQALLAAVVMVGVNLTGVHSLVLVLVGFALSVSSNGFVMANVLGLAMREHGERAGTAAGLVGFTISIFGATTAPLTSIFFGLNLTSITHFMAALILVSAGICFIGLRKEKPLVH